MASQTIKSVAGNSGRFPWGWVIFGVVAVATIGGTIVIVSAINKGPFGIL